MIFPPIRIYRLCPSTDLKAEFTARADFDNLVQDFIQDIGNDWIPTQQKQEYHRQLKEPTTPP